MAAQSPLPTVMRAWQYTSTRNGLEKSLRINSSTPLPTPKSGQHLVQITTVALNPVDYKIAEFPGVALLAPKPATPGIDFAGHVVRPAPNSALKAGQRVFGACGTSPLAGGALAEFSISKTECAAAVPDGVEGVHAATVGVAGLTAYQSILPHVKPEDKVFINGGSGGTGVFGIQIAKAVGCHVTTTCSTGNVELCRSLGADRVIDYKNEDVLTALKGCGNRFDHAVDNVGSNKELLWHSHEFMQQGAVYVLVAGNPSLGSLVDTLKRKTLPRFLGGMKGKVVGFWPQPKVEDLTQIGEWMRSGKVKAIIDQRFKFEEAPQAFERLKTGRARGKVVIDVASETGKNSSA